MTAWIWLLAAAVAGVAAYFVGWRAWEQYRLRDHVDANTDRYLGWRGQGGASASGCAGTSR